MRRLVLAAFTFGTLAAGPAVAAPRWTLDIDGDGAMLTTGAPHHGGPGVTALNCAGGEKAATINFISPRHQTDGGEVRATIRSGSVVGRFPAEAAADDETGGTAIETTVSMTTPVMRAFARTGKRRLTAFGAGPADAPVPPAKAARFARVCLQ